MTVLIGSIGGAGGGSVARSMPGSSCSPSTWVATASTLVTGGGAGFFRLLLAGCERWSRLPIDVSSGAMWVVRHLRLLGELRVALDEERVARERVVSLPLLPLLDLLDQAVRLGLGEVDLELPLLLRRVVVEGDLEGLLRALAVGPDADPREI